MIFLRLIIMNCMKEKFLRGWENNLTPEMLHKIDIEAVEEHSIILNYKNYKDGYCSQWGYI